MFSSAPSVRATDPLGLVVPGARGGGSVIIKSVPKYLGERK